MESLNKLFKSALETAENYGNAKQQNDIAAIVGQTAQPSCELYDLMAGVRKRSKHSHYPIPDLTNAMIDGIQIMTTIRSEIRANKK